MDFFSRLESLLANVQPVSIVNALIANTDWHGFVVTDEFCSRWLNNHDKKSNVRTKQMFGSFFDFGDKDYLLHLDLATTNIYLGLVRGAKQGEGYHVEPMTEEHVVNALERYPDLRALSPILRLWGPRWLAVDIGSFINMLDPGTFLFFVEPVKSVCFQQIMLPFVAALKPRIEAK